jgi:hypothetical protein
VRDLYKKGKVMQKYAKHCLAIVMVFFLSVLYFRPEMIEAEVPGTENESNPSTQNSSDTVMVCVSAGAARHGLDTQMRKNNAEFARTFYLTTTNARPAQHRCYFKVPQKDIGCFKARVLSDTDKTHLEDNGFVVTPSFSGGKPGQQCYFKKDAIGKYTNLIRILGGDTTMLPNDRQELMLSTVSHPHQAVMRIRGEQ